MTDTQALRDLLVKVEDGDRFGIIPLGQKALGPTDDYEYRHGHLVCKAFNGSLDAAKALHDAVLPGWRFNVHFEQHMDGHYCAMFGAIPDDAEKWTFAPKWEAKTPLQSRSLLACILRALIAQATL